MRQMTGASSCRKPERSQHSLSTRLRQIPFERLHAGDLIVVHAGQTVSADG